MLEYLKVEPRYRQLACGLYVVLVTCFLGYAAHEIHRIGMGKPPVSYSVEEWRGAGKWMLCGSQALRGAGMAIPTVRAPISERVPEPVGNKGLVLRDTDKGSCTEIDLSGWEMPLPPPLAFNLCVDIPEVKLYSNSAGEWNFVSHMAEGTMLWLKMAKHKHGWDFGYSSNLQEYIDVAEHRTALCTDQCPDWTRFSSSKGKGTFIKLVIENPTVPVTEKQGVLPQLFALSAKLGGYLSLLTVVFTAILVRKYPESEVALTYEARTLFGNQQTQTGDDRDSQMGATGNLCTNASPARLPDSDSTRLLQQRQMHAQFPELPPGIINHSARPAQQQQMPAISPARIPPTSMASE